MEEFSERLCDLLHNKNMTQLELAEKAGLTQAAVSHYVKGSRMPQVRTLQKLAQALDVSIPDLIGQDPADDNALADAVRVVVCNAERLTDAQKMSILSAVAGVK